MSINLPVLTIPHIQFTLPSLGRSSSQFILIQFCLLSDTSFPLSLFSVCELSCPPTSSPLFALLTVPSHFVPWSVHSLGSMSSLPSILVRSLLSLRIPSRLVLIRFTLSTHWVAPLISALIALSLSPLLPVLLPVHSLLC